MPRGVPSDGNAHWDNRRLSALVLILLIAQYVLGVLDVTLLAPVWLQIVHLLGADVLWAALVVLTARLTLEPAEQRSQTKCSRISLGATMKRPLSGAFFVAINSFSCLPPISR